MHTHKTMNTSSRNRLVALVTVLFALLALCTPSLAHADTITGGTYAIPTQTTGSVILAKSSTTSSNDTEAQNQLRAYALKQLSGNSYEQSGGGSISGVDMFTNDSSGQIQVNEDNWAKLDSAGKKAFSSDLNNAVTSATNANKQEKVTQGTQDVTTETSDNWLKDLSTMDGWGSEFMSNVMANVAKPQWQTAATIVAPFSGVFGTAVALIVIVLFMMLAVTIGLDLFYIMIPFARTFSKDGKSYLVSREAIAAVEGADGGDKKRSVIFTYFKARAFGILMLCFVIELLITNQLFPLIAQAMNLVGGLVSLV